MLFKDFSYILRAFDMKFSQTFFKSYGEIIWNWALQKLVQIYQGGSPGETDHREFCLKQKNMFNVKSKLCAFINNSITYRLCTPCMNPILACTNKQHTQYKCKDALTYMKVCTKVFNFSSLDIETCPIDRILHRDILMQILCRKCLPKPSFKLLFEFGK